VGGQKATSRPLYPRGRDPVHIVLEAGWASWLIWTGVENLALPALIHSFIQFNMYSVQLAVKTQLIYCTVCTMYKNYMFRPI